MFAFFGQLHQLAQPVVDHLDQRGVLFGVRAQELGIVGLQLGREVRIADLEADRETAIAFQHAALLVALQGLITLRFPRPEDIAQLDRTTALHFLHRRSQLGRRNTAVLFAKIVTRPHLFPIATLTGDLDHLPAGQILWTFPVVTGCLALVDAVCADCGATLAANFGLGLADILVARFDALVAVARKRFGARQATAEGAQVAGDGFALFVLAVAVLGGKDDARGTVGFGVTVVEDGVGARVLSGAGFITGWFARSARHRREDYGSATLAGQFVEGDAVAGAAGAPVTGLVAAMPAAGKGLVARLWTDVIVVDAAFLVAFVLGAATQAGAALFAASVVGSGLQLFAFDLLVHVAAATFDGCGFVARRTLVQVAFGVANVVRSGTSAGQLLAADGFTGRDGVQAAFAFSLDDGLLSARTGCDYSG